MDPEQQPPSMQNTTIHNISWRGLGVSVTDSATKKPKTLVEDCEAIVEAGSCSAPSRLG